MKFIKDILGMFLLQPSAQHDQWSGEEKLNVLEFPDFKKIVEMQILKISNYCFYLKDLKIFHKIKFLK